MVEYIATVGIDRVLHVSMIRHAISPLLAMRILDMAGFGPVFGGGVCAYRIFSPVCTNFDDSWKVELVNPRDILFRSIRKEEP